MYAKKERYTVIDGVFQKCEDGWLERVDTQK